MGEDRVIARATSKFGAKASTFEPLDALLKPEPWMRDALCAETDPEAFFPDKGGSVRAAKAICSECDVIEECLAYALARGERFGIWGGMSERERRRMKRGQPASVRQNRAAYRVAATRSNSFSTRRRFTAEEDAIVMRMHADGRSDAAIARELSRRPQSVAARRRLIGAVS